MKTTTRKIALACFFGGAIGCVVALWAAPVFWWLGVLAGFAAGYIGYEFREVLHAIPIALGRAWSDTQNTFHGWHESLVEICEQAKQLTLKKVLAGIAKCLLYLVLIVVGTVLGTIGEVLAMCFLAILFGINGLCHLIVMIHSKKRLLCGIHSALGVIASYIWLAPYASSSTQRAVIVVFGGVLSMGFGLGAREFISKRILHVPQGTTT